MPLMCHQRSTNARRGTASSAAHKGSVSALRCKMNSARGKLARTRRTFAAARSSVAGTWPLFAAVALI